MARPNSNVDIEDEKELTRRVCQRVKQMSGLTYVELEIQLDIVSDKANKNGSPTGRNFARYCQPDKAKSRAASRDTLHKIINKSIACGWLKPNFLDALGGNIFAASIPLDKLPTEAFENRQREVDQVTDQLRRLLKEIENTTSMMSNLKHCLIIEQVDESNDFWRRLHQFVYDSTFDDESTVNSDLCPPISIAHALDWLRWHLAASQIELLDGFEAMPKPRFTKTKPLTATETTEHTKLSKMLDVIAAS